MQTAPPRAPFAYESASVSVMARPPIKWKMKGAAADVAVEKIAPSARANRKAWKTKSLARSAGSSAPSARATAEDTPTPIPLFVVCRTSMIQGNASDAPASASVPIRPRKNPSNVITPTNARKLSTFGAASRSNVEKDWAFKQKFGEADGRSRQVSPSLSESDQLCLHSHQSAPRSLSGTGAALGQRVLGKPGGCNESPTHLKCGGHFIL